jgi:hypothetical protein
MSRAVLNIGSDGSDDEFNFQLKELETPGARKRRRARLEASGGTTQRDPVEATATGALDSGGSGRGYARGSGPKTPKQKALDEAAVAAARTKKARVQQSHERSNAGG